MEGKDNKEIINLRNRSRSYDITTINKISTDHAFLNMNDEEDQFVLPQFDNNNNRGGRKNGRVTVKDEDQGHIKIEGDPVDVDEKLEKTDNENHKQGETVDQGKIFGFFQNLKGITLENKSSVARDHMANERTLLAWVRTSTTFMTFAVGFIQYFRLEIRSNSKVVEDGSVDVIQGKMTYNERLMKPLGTMCIILSLLTLTFGCIRYFQVQVLLTRDYYPTTRLFVIVLMIINMAILWLLFVIDIKLTS